MSKSKIIPLKYGATLLYKKRTLNKSAFICLTYNVGASNTAYQPGILHFGEHLRAKRTKNMNQAECSAYSTKLDAMTNAATGPHYVKFLCENSTKNLEETFQFICDKMVHNSIAEDEFDREKTIIASEILNRKDDDDYQSYHHLIKLATQNPYYHSNVLGETEDITNFKQQEIQNHIGDIINSNNLVVQVAGNLSKHKAKKLVYKHALSQISHISPTIQRLNDHPNFYETSQISVVTNDNKTAYVKIAFPYYLEDGLAGVKTEKIIGSYILPLFNKRDGIIFRSLRTETGLIYSGYSSSYYLNMGRLFTITYKIKKENIKKSLDILAKEVQNISISNEKFEEFKNIVKLREDKTFPKSLRGSADNMYAKYTDLGKFYSARTYKKITKSITKQDVDNMLKQLFTNNRLFFHSYGAATKQDIYTIAKIHRMFFQPKK